MNYIILDMEWNQAVSRSTMIHSPVELHGEIIRIGAIKTNEKHEYIDDFKISVKPKFYTRIHRHVSRITGLTSEDLKNGVSFKDAFDSFISWCGKDSVILTWGYDDIPMLKDNMMLYGIDTTELNKWYNLQVIFDNQILCKKQQCALSYAVDMVKEPPAVAHDAFNDALSTYRVCRHLNLERGIREYSSLKSTVFSKVLPADEKTVFHDFVGGRYTSRSVALKDEAVTSFVCPVCGKKVYCKKWISQNQNKKVALCKCPGGKNYFVRLKFAKDHKGRFMAKQVVYNITEEEKAVYKKRFLKPRRKKTAKI